MTDKPMLAYDRQRVVQLATKTREAIDYLSATKSDEPVAASALRSVRDIAFRLETTWLPLLAGIEADTSMTSWDGAGPAGISGGRTNRNGSTSHTGSDNDDFLAALAAAADAPQPSVAVGPPAIPPEMLAELAERWDELTPEQQQAAILAILAFGQWNVLNGLLPFLEGSLDDLLITPYFAGAVINVVAETGEVPPGLAPLVARIAEEYGPELAVALGGQDDPALLAALGIAVPLAVDPAAAAAFLEKLPPDVRAAIEAQIPLDTSDFSLADSVVADDPDGNGWAGEVGLHANATDQDAYYQGGGFVIGPDGNSYPIVVPTVVTDDGTFTADASPVEAGEDSVANLGGEDEGWRVVGVATGTERIVEAPGREEQGAVILAGGNGDTSVLPPNSELDHIAINPTGLPSITDTPQTAGQPSGDANAGINTAVVVTSLDNQRESAYLVTFEVNEDGRRRATITTYNLGAGGDVMEAQHLYVNDDDELVNQWVSYGSPYSDDPYPESDDLYPAHQHGGDFNPFPIPGAVFP